VEQHSPLFQNAINIGFSLAIFKLDVGKWFSAASTARRTCSSHIEVLLVEWKALYSDVYLPIIFREKLALLSSSCNTTHNYKPFIRVPIWRKTGKNPLLMIM
jgi:hypothetical protein